MGQFMTDFIVCAMRGRATEDAKIVSYVVKGEAVSYVGLGIAVNKGFGEKKKTTYYKLRFNDETRDQALTIKKGDLVKVDEGWPKPEGWIDKKTGLVKVTMTIFTNQFNIVDGQTGDVITGDTSGENAFGD